MKNHSNVFLGGILVLICVALVLSNAGCKKDGGSNTEPPKTLTKSLLYGKTWHNKGNTVAHHFNADGTYYAIGKWKWLNNSDTMEIKITINGDIFLWHFEWNTEHEFSAKRIGTSSAILFKDEKW